MNRIVRVTLALLLGVTSAAADQVTSKGTVLNGKIAALASTGVSFDSDYGKGTLKIAWADVEAFSSEGSFQVLYGDDQEAYGALSEFHDGALTVGTTAIDVTTIYSGLPSGDGGPTFRERMRSTWRYWSGYLDLGFALQQSTIDTVGFSTGLGLRRTKDPTRFISLLGYRYAAENKRHESSNVIEEEAKGLLRGEYDLLERVYTYGSGDLEYDSVERLSLRSVSKAGFGYTIYRDKLDESRENFLRADVGGAYVYKKFFGGETDKFEAVSFGALAQYFLPYNSRFEWTFDYLPAVDDFTNNYLLRSTASLAILVLDPISVKLAAKDEYTSVAADDADHNSLFFAAGLSVAW